MLQQCPFLIKCGQISLHCPIGNFLILFAMFQMAKKTPELKTDVDNFTDLSQNNFTINFLYFVTLSAWLIM
jgi:hypothetical protein